MSNDTTTPVFVNWYASETGNHQGHVLCCETGENIAVTYDKKDAPLVAAAPALLRESKALVEKLRNMAFHPSHYSQLEQVIHDLENSS